MVKLGGFAFEVLVYGQSTGDSTPLVTGLAAFEPFSGLTASINGETYQTTINGDQTWSILTDTLPAGYHDVVVQVGSTDTYRRPGGVDTYRRPDGTSLYKRPGGESYVFEGALQILSDYWVFHDGSGGFDRQLWHL